MERNSLPLEVWQAERAELRQRVRPWTTGRLERGRKQQKHPVYDFLFEYYPYRPAHLERYSPGLNVSMEGAVLTTLDWRRFFSVGDGGATILPSPALLKHLPAVRWGISFLRATLERSPVLHCFGLHEWAMVYKTGDVRHPQIPLRLTGQEVAACVESQRLCCTHFDAFRFFTEAAAPLNRHHLSRAAMIEHDQPGCIHVNMDLYKWAYRIAPLTSSRVIVDTFAFARQAREIDMRASPYDLSSLGFEPIRIETKDGREEYVAYQRGLHERSQRLRERLLREYECIEADLSSVEGEHR